jgi:ASC-1-like (ASCH) protein
MRIEKGVQPGYFKAVKDGRKSFEVRLADFECKPGDVLVLREQKEGSKDQTGEEVLDQFNTKKIEEFYSKKDIEKYGLVVLAIRKKYNF